jgi:tRNA A-37 threonylcarbamoyl transferase component Bud32
LKNVIGQRWGNYRLIRLLGHGGFAQVYLGKHVRLGKHVAIKILSAPLVDEAIQSFQREAQVIASLVHPHIVRLLDFDVKDGWPFLVLEYAPDGTLDQRHRHGTRLSLPETVTYVSQVANALQYAHDNKLIHRDVKPANMLIGQGGEILLTDFGLATVAHSTTSMHTQVPIGTLAYIAPEQIQGHPRAASDQYALGIVAYRWLTGSLPFLGSPTEVIAQHLTQTPPPLGELVPHLPAGVEEVIQKALAKDPRERFDRVQDFADELRQAAEPPTTRSILSLERPLAQPQVAVAPEIASSPSPELRASPSPEAEDAEATLTRAAAQAEAPIYAAGHELPALKPSPPMLLPLALRRGQRAAGGQRRIGRVLPFSLARQKTKLLSGARSNARAGAVSQTLKGRRIHLLLAVLALLLIAGVALWSALFSAPPARSNAQASLVFQTGSIATRSGGATPTHPPVSSTPAPGAPVTQPTSPPTSGGKTGSTGATSAPQATPTSAPPVKPTPTTAPTVVPTAVPTPAPTPTPAPPCLSGSPGTITITQVVGATLSLSGTAVTLTNCGATSGHWVASSQLNNGSGWTSCAPTSGDLPAHSSQTVHIAVGSSHVLLGTYTGQWVFTMGGASWTVHIKLIVVA